MFYFSSCCIFPFFVFLLSFLFHLYLHTSMHLLIMLYIYRSERLLEESGVSVAPPKCSRPTNPNPVPTQLDPVPTHATLAMTRQHCSDNPGNDHIEEEQDDDNKSKRSLPCPTDSCWNLAESAGMKFGRGPCQNWNSGDP